MHSDVCIEIAYSGEFFVRPLRHKHQAPRSSAGRQAAESDQDEPDEANDATHGDVGFDEDNPPDDPALYELVIDNDSGTYRPRADLLPTLHSYLASPRNLGALGKVTCIQAFDDHLKEWKEKRKAAKTKEGKKAAQPSGSLSSSASSSVSSLSSTGAPAAEGVKVGDMQAVVEEDAKRARDNDDADEGAKEEEDQVPVNDSVSKQQ